VNHLSLFIYEIQVPEVNEIPREISQDENRVHAMNGVSEENKAATQAEIPEGNGDNALLFFLRRNPLEQEPHGEHRLANKAEDDPEVQSEFRILLKEV
jgi:hypothetical protein